MEDYLKQKRILIVDDEPDVLETLRELLDMCSVDSAPDFNTARTLLNQRTYDAAILDIMGVSGYDLLELSNERGIPAIVLTAHALSPEDLVKSITEGALCYLPKAKMVDITDYLVEVLQASEKGSRISRKWFMRVKPYFDKKFGPEWTDRHQDFLRNFNLAHTREELEEIL